MRVVRSYIAALTLAVVGAAMFVSPTTVSSAAAATEPDAYRVQGLPSYITEPTEFTIDPSGTQQICAMHFRGITLTAPPWTFTADPPEDGEDRGEIEVDPCAGSPDFVPVTKSKPIVFRTRTLFPDALRETALHITNNTDEDVSVTLVSPKGESVATFTVPGGREESSKRDLHVRPEVLDRLTRTSTFTLRAVVDGGVVETAPLVVARGWTRLDSADGRSAHGIAPCSRVTWSYDASRQPRTALTFGKDVAEAFARLGKVTGLDFVRVPLTDQDAAIRIDWSALGVDGPSGLAGTDGHVSFNTQDGWPTDLYAGFSSLHGSPADRGWLIVHEFMHVLGFDHVPGRSSIMTPINYGQHQLSRGDLEGLHTIYPTSGCSATP